MYDTKAMLDTITKDRVWIEVKKNIFMYKDKDSFSVIHPNVISFGNVKEWQCENCRVTKRLRITAPTYYDNNDLALRDKGVLEADYLNSIEIPIAAPTYSLRDKGMAEV